MNKEERFVLVCGHPRSGTGYMAAALQAFGYDVGHEKMGAHGIASWLFALENPRWGPDPLGFEFLWRILVVRNPIAVMSSTIISAAPWAVAYIDRSFGIDPDIDPLVRAVLRYLEFDRRIRVLVRPSMTVNVEAAPEQLGAGLRRRRPLRRLPATNVNAREEMENQCCRVPDIPVRAWLDAVPATLWLKLCRLAAGYGYMLPRAGAAVAAAAGGEQVTLIDGSRLIKARRLAADRWYGSGGQA